MNTPFNLLIKRLEIGGANGLAGHGAVGFPAMTAFLGLSQVIARAVAGAEQGRFLHRFAVVHHTGHARIYGAYRDRLTQKRYLYAEAGEPNKTEHWQSPPAEFQAQVDLTLSLLLETRLPAERAAWLAAHPGLLAECVGQRALGGVIRRHNRVLVGPDPLALLAQAGSGHAIADLTPELFTGDGRDPLEVMLDRLSTPGDPASPDRPFMAHTGYLAVSAADPSRTTARGAVPHVFAEPVFGLAAFRRTFAVDALAPVFWRPVFDRTNATFTLKGEAL
ncbi:MAG: hypothetical protein H7838_13070 [Magnetococcus sp. DMHC-8]